MTHRITTRAALAIALAAAAAAATSSTASANDLYWQGGTADLGATNYVDSLTSTANVAPNSTDTALIGADGTANHASGDLSLGKLWVGHNLTGGGTGALPGAGTVNVTGGTVNVTLGGGNGVDTGLFVGYGANGTLNIDAATVNVNNFVNVGYGGDRGVTGTVNITNGGTLNITTGNFATGDDPLGNTGRVGGTAHVFVNGNINVSGSGDDMVIGVWGTSDYTQTGGAVSVNQNSYVGRRDADGSSFTLSGGTFSTGTNFTASDGSVSQGRSENVAVTVSGNASLNVGSILSAGANASQNASITFSGDSSVTVGDNITVGSGSAAGTTWTIADNAHVSVGTNGANNVYIGRGTTSNTTFNMTGGTLDITKYFLMGTAAAGTSTATNIVGNQSGGTVTTTSNFVLSDAGGDSTYNLSGTGTANIGGTLLVGRRNAVAVFNQTGGSANVANGVRIGDAFSTDTTTYATGTYNVSGGTLAATLADPTTGDALAVAPAGTGTLHVIGDDATVNVTGNMGVYANTNGGSNVGTLAYTLEAGEGLTEINVTGTATFATGSVLSLDLAGLTPSQSSFDLLTAADIVDNGLSFSAPTGWNFQIVSGGNGEVLQAFTMATVHNPGDTNNDGVVDLTDLNNVLNNFGSTGTGNPGDDDSSGNVDLTDLNNVLNNFGTTYAAAALNVVPEPASLSLLGLGAAALVGRRRRCSR